MQGEFSKSYDDSYFGIIKCKDGDLTVKDFIPRILHGDIVDAQNDIGTIVPYRGIIYGQIMFSEPIMGHTKGTNSKAIRNFVPYDTRFPHMRVPCKRRDKVNHYASVKVTGWVDDFTPIAQLMSLIGLIGDKKAEFTFIKVRHGVNWKKRTEKYDRAQPDPYDKTRKVFDQDNIYSIDPKGCKDIDDALHVKILPNDDYEIGIHIADVSSFVLPDTELDHDGRNRAESLYLNGVQNMYPDQLVERMSLVENQKRRSYSMIMVIDKEHNIKSVKFEHLVVTVMQNLSYEEADKIIKNKKNDTLELLYDIGKQFYMNKYGKGCMESYDVHEMVAIFMITCNTYAARFLNKKGYYRSFSRKNLTGIDCIDTFLSDKAQYVSSRNNKGHTMVKEAEYTHFTSPIRRYIDVIVHRQLSDPDNNFLCDIDHINKMHDNIRKSSMEMNIINWISALDDGYETTIKTIGIIVDIDRYYTLYVPEYKLYVKNKIYPDTVVTVGDHINITIVATIRNFRMTEKLMCQFTDKFE
jgi:hypothetical protein